MVDVRIGISGWCYAPWRATFYPRGLRKSKELEFASRALRSIEINGSFYSLQRPSTYARWYNETVSSRFSGSVRLTCAPARA
jgi:uncharacterized protein YecE (DUF72 family)